MNEENNLKYRWLEYSPMFISQSALMLLILIDYTLTDNISHQIGWLFYPLLGLTFILIIMPLFKFYIKFTRRYIFLFFYYLAFGIFIIFYAPVVGAYYFIFLLYLTVSMYWYNWKGYIGAIAITVLISLLAVLHQYPYADTIFIYQVGIQFAVFLVSSLFIALLFLRKPMIADATFLRDTATFERTRLTSLINSMTDAVVATDETGVITLYNGAALSLFNTNESIENQPLDYFVKFRDENNNSVDLIKIVGHENRTLERKDLHFISNEKIQVDVDVNVSPIRSIGRRSNNEQGLMFVIRDITAEKSLENERKDFISVTSHELRTPIAVTEANIATALRPKVADQLDPAVKELLEQAHKNIIFLGDLVNDLATLDKAEHDELGIHISLIEPINLLADILKDYQPDAQKAGLELRLDEVADVSSLLSSEVYIREILQNFVSNAIKYTHQGVITLKAVQGKGGSVIFSVSDTGIGISSSDKKNIFTKFYRSESIETQNTRGTGLGLYITNKLAKRIKGKIWFDSEVNQGSTFYLEVPPVGALKQDQQKVAQEEIKEFASSV